MAEVITALGIIASITQLAEYGFRLSVKLYTFSEAVSTADKSIKTISNDVSLTSTVLKELCQILQSDDSHIVSEMAVRATEQTVKECLAVFEQLNEGIDKSLENLGLVEGEDKRNIKKGTMTLERLKWPFKQGKMELLRGNLDRLKASLTLMLQVLNYASDISNRKTAESSLAYQQRLIEKLSRSEQVMKRRYLALQQVIESQNPHQDFHINNNIFMTTTDFQDVNDNDSDGLPQQNGITSPNAKPQILTGELLLCSQLLQQILTHTTFAEENPKCHIKEYEELRAALLKVRDEELAQLNSDYPNLDAIHILQGSAQNIQKRMRGFFSSMNVRDGKLLSFERGWEQDLTHFEPTTTIQEIQYTPEVAVVETHHIEHPIVMKTRIAEEIMVETESTRKKRISRLWTKALDGLKGFVIGGHNRRKMSGSPGTTHNGSHVDNADDKSRVGDGDGRSGDDSGKVSDEVRVGDSELKTDIVAKLLEDWTTLPLKDQNSVSSEKAPSLSSTTA